jgi:hypothetical protein
MEYSHFKSMWLLLLDFRGIKSPPFCFFLSFFVSFLSEYVIISLCDNQCIWPTASIQYRIIGQVCRASLPGKSAGQVCRASLPGKSAGQVCRASLPGKFSHDRKKNGCYRHLPVTQNLV